MEVKNSTKYMAEFIGTMVLVLMGCGSAVIAGADGTTGVGLLGIAFAFGLSVVVMAYTIGPISGCHINPAISVSMLVAGKLSSKDTIGYIVSQMLGATAGAGILCAIACGKADFTMGEWGLGSNGWGPGYLGEYSMVAAFIAEAVFTFIFLMVIFGSTSSQNTNGGFAGLAIGLCLVLIHIVGIKVTGVSVNPARSFGPAIFAGGNALSQLWLFFIAPITGGVLASLVWKNVLGRD